MAGGVIQRIKDWDSKRRKKLSDELLDLTDRRRIDSFIRWHDHGLFRELWTNQAEIAPGVWRSNHPPSKRFAGFRRLGIKTILNLRGPGQNVTYLWERKLADDHGISFHSIALDARKAPHPQAMLDVISFLREAEKPLLFHCKSGADRAGLVAAAYLLVFEGVSLEQARTMLSPRFLHFRKTKTGILDEVLDTYAPRAADIGFEDWLRTEYDPDQVQAAFDARQGAGPKDKS